MKANILAVAFVVAVVVVDVIVVVVVCWRSDDNDDDGYADVGDSYDVFELTGNKNRCFGNK